MQSRKCADLPTRNFLQSNAPSTIKQDFPIHMKPISVQLYSLREQCQEDFDQVLADLADIGYAGVEPFNLYGKSPTEFKAQVEGLGMQISSSHFPWANRAELGDVVETIHGLGLNRVAAGFGGDDVNDGESLKKTVDAINAITDRYKTHGLSVFIHNHYWEFEPIDGKLPYHTFYDECPDLQFEVDTYWAANFGACDPAAEVANVKDRAPLLHIKDGPNERGKAHVACGDGVIDIPAIIQAADPGVLEWVIVELDACDTDMLEAVRRSYTYLTANELAAGTR